MAKFEIYYQSYELLTAPGCQYRHNWCDDRPFRLLHARAGSALWHCRLGATNGAPVCNRIRARWGAEPHLPWISEDIHIWSIMISSRFLRQCWIAYLFTLQKRKLLSKMKWFGISFRYYCWCVFYFLGFCETVCYCSSSTACIILLWCFTVAKSYDIF